MISPQNFGRVPPYGEQTRDQINRVMAEVELLARLNTRAPLRFGRDAGGYYFWLDTLALGAESITWTGDQVFEGDVVFNGTATSTPLVLRHVTLGTNQNNYALPDACNVLVVDLSADVTITGVVPPDTSKPHVLWIHNEHSTNRIIITNEDAASTAANRFRTPNAQTLYLTRAQGFGWAWSPDDQLWFPLDERFSVDGTAVHRINFDSGDFDVTFSAGVATVALDAAGGASDTVSFLSDVTCSTTGGLVFDISEMTFTNGLFQGTELIATYTCECCEVDGTSGDPPTVETTCCPDDLLPETLYATFGGALSSLGTKTLTHSGGTWSAAVGAVCGMHADTVVTLTCIGSNWTVTLAKLTITPAIYYQQELAETSCDPLLIESSATSSASGCSGAATVDITESSP